MGSRAGRDGAKPSLATHGCQGHRSPRNARRRRLTMASAFPPEFIFGTSTAATQIETAFDHDWQGFKARDGHVFQRTTDHELRMKEDARIISSLAPGYRMSLSWSRLQRGPMADLD